MHFTIYFLALFFLPAFAQLEPFIPKIGDFVSVKIGNDPGGTLAVVVGYHGPKIMGAYVYPPIADNTRLPPGMVPISGFYTSSLVRGYTVKLAGRVINMNFATERKDLEPMSLTSVENLKREIKSITPVFYADDEAPRKRKFLAAAKKHASKLETAASGTAASNKASSSSGNNAMTHGPTSPPRQGSTRRPGPPSHRFRAAVQGATGNTGPGPGIQASSSESENKATHVTALQSGTIKASSSGNHDKAVTDATTKPSSPSPAGQNADPQVHATTNVQTSRSGVTYDTKKASQGNTGGKFQFGTIGASSSGNHDKAEPSSPSPAGQNADPQVHATTNVQTSRSAVTYDTRKASQSNTGRQFQFGTIGASSSGDVTTTMPTSPGQRNVGPPSQVHAPHGNAPGPQVGTTTPNIQVDPNAPSSSDPPILGSNIIVHPGFGHDLQEPKKDTGSQKK